MSFQRFSAFCIALLGVFAPPLVKAASVAADTPDSDIAICIYRISGTYGIFARWIYYASLLAAVIFRRAEWLSAGILASAMLYSSAAVVHACAILRVSGLNPEVLDADIIPVTTIILATAFLTWAVASSTTFHKTRAWPIITLWNFWIWTGTAICAAATWILLKNPREAHFAETICYDNSTPTPTFLSSRAQLSSREYSFDCSYRCFASRSSTIRNAEEIFAVSVNDIYSKYVGALPGFCVGGVLGALPIAYHLPAIGALMRYRAPDSEAQKGFMNEQDGYLVSLQIFWFLLSVLPALAVIVLGEGAMLRRESLLRTESLRAVGQWTSFVCVVLVVCVSLSDKYIFEPYRIKEELEDTECAQRVARRDEQRKNGYDYVYGVQEDIELVDRLATPLQASCIFDAYGPLTEDERRVVDELVKLPEDIHARQ